ncbi:MAG: Asp-tRNA(Asn)/Glu-tRNA(Gln) amidotransferase subunit GatC, partial [Proteobacteria bacterium]|nr:Asp-tRNA(Asn)/Glu-tRNA(Gln) amidotransferase subunit GatC [Pseudomonadota bacterium]
FTEKEIDEYCNEVNGILAWIDILDEVDTKKVDPMYGVSDKNLKIRRDEITEHPINEEILSNAPAAKYGYFIVPKVVE